LNASEVHGTALLLVVVSAALGMAGGAATRAVASRVSPS
jgi:hypothetical protein